MKSQTFLIRCEYPDGDRIPTQEFVENIQEYFAANIMDGKKGRLVVKPVYQPKEEGVVEEENGTTSNPFGIKSNANCLTQERADEINKLKPKFKVGDKVMLDLYPCVVTDVHWRDSLHGFVYTVRGTDFGKIVKEEKLKFFDVAYLEQITDELLHYKVEPKTIYRGVPLDDFISLVRRMREAQKRTDNLAGGEDIDFVDMLCIEQREAEREVDEYLKKL